MGSAISSFFSNFTERNLPVAQVSDYVRYSQSESYFRLAALKNERSVRLINNFAAHGVKKVLISANLSGFDFKLKGLDSGILEKGFFHETDPAAIEIKKSMLEDAIVIVNNNDVGHNNGMPHYANFFNQCDRTIFAVWDWDNHHWMDLSLFLAVHSDLYIPVHHENLYLLSRYNWKIAGPIYAGTVQWSKEFLDDHLPEMIGTKRSDAPLGMHIPYSPFQFRNQVVSTLSQHYPTIGFTDRTFHARSPEERFTEWCEHKSHWIVPVLNDIPIRIFDALITGGIPIVPESLRFLPPVAAINREHIVFYTPQDILNPNAIVAEATKLFDSGKNEGMLERHRYAIKNHHGDVCMHQILGFVAEGFGLNLRSPSFQN